MILASLGIFAMRYMAISPTFVLMSMFVLSFLFASKPQSREVEQFAPVYTSSVVSGLSTGVASIQGRRQYMEDMHQAYAFDEREHPAAARVGLTHLFAVFDGHGGKRAAAWAHTHLASNLLHELAQDDPPPPGATPAAHADALDSATVDAFRRTDSEFLQHAAGRGIPDGSTAVVCMVQAGAGAGSSVGGAAGAGAHGAADGAADGAGAPDERRLLVANLGDSRCVLVRSDGSALALSSDHKPNRPDERARVHAAGGHVIYAGCWRVQGDLAVSRAFGDVHLKQYGVSATPELSAIGLSRRDAFVVLASDGLWDVVDEQQCAASVLRAADPLSAARALCDLASTRGSMDNITVLVVAL